MRATARSPSSSRRGRPRRRRRIRRRRSARWSAIRAWSPTAWRSRSKRAPLGINVAVADSNGNSDVEHVRVEPSVDGARFSPRLLAPLLAAFAPGEPLPVLEPEHGRMLLVDVADDARRVWAIFAKHGDTFPPEAHAQLFERLAHMDAKLPVALPRGAARRALARAGDRRAAASPRCRGVARARAVRAAGRRSAAVSARRRPARRDGRARRQAPLCPPRLRRRGRARRSRARSAPLETAEEGPPGCFRLDDPESALAAVVAVAQSPPPGIAAEWIDGRRVVPSGSAAAAARRDRSRSATGSASSASSRSSRAASSSRSCSMPRAASSASCGSTRTAGSSSRARCASGSASSPIDRSRAMPVRCCRSPPPR